MPNSYTLSPAGRKCRIYALALWKWGGGAFALMAKIVYLFLLALVHWATKFRPLVGRNQALCVVYFIDSKENTCRVRCSPHQVQPNELVS